MFFGAILLIAVPSLIFWVSSKSREELEEESFKTKYGAFYLKLKTEYP
jgi:hypothetical protein